MAVAQIRVAEAAATIDSRAAIDVVSLFATARADAEGPTLADGFRRVRQALPAGSICLDATADGSAACLFLRTVGPVRLVIRDPAGHPAEISRCSGGGWLMRWPQPAKRLLWIPRPPVARRIDAWGRIASQVPAEISALRICADSAVLELDTMEDVPIDLVVWSLDARAAGPRDKLLDRSPLESPGWFAWGTHDRYARPADLYNYLVHGHVYENRFAWPSTHRICSENDAHSLYVTLRGLLRSSGSALHHLMQRQLVLSVLDRQAADGAFRHGEWTDALESHYRLHCSAMHLLMDVLAAGYDERVLHALQRAAAFVARQHQRLPIGTWFIHDELEHSTAALAKGPFRWVASTVLGKTASNMLVLNTQLDTTIALDRYGEVTGDRSYHPLVESANAATSAVLGLRSGQWLYAPIFRLIALTFLPTARAQRLPLWQRALKRVAWKYLIPRLPRLKSRRPRLVMPGGYIDRELSLETWAHDYHAINLMDLARHYRRFRTKQVWEALNGGIRFARHSGILERWKEMPYQRYALGFWAETLYHVCLLEGGSEYRAWLAEAMLDLEELGMGLPPSLLGANAEAVSPDDQLPCPVPSDPHLRVANLSASRCMELLVVNCGSTPVRVGWQIAPVRAMEWAGTSMAGRLTTDELSPLPPRAWLRGTEAGAITGTK